MIVRTRTPLRVERGHDISAKILVEGSQSPIGPLIVLLPGDELRFPGGVPGEELVVEIDLREISASNHARALLRLQTEIAHNEEEAQQERLFP